MVDLQDQAVVAILTRAPASGGKTRLFSALGRPPDSDLLAALFLDTFDSAGDAGFTRVVCYTPEDAGAEMRALVGEGVPLLPQRGDDLGDRMCHAFEDLFAAGAAAVVLVGSDLPLLDPDVLSEAHEVLRTRPGEVVLGPSTDGGYYLVGATQAPATLFDRMTWGRADVFEQTERRARAAGLDVHRVAAMCDVDTPGELRRLTQTTGPRGARTREWARRLLVDR